MTLAEEQLEVLSHLSGYMRVMLKMPLYDWQYLLVDGLEKPGSRAALVANNECGKTWMAAGVALAHMNTFRNSLTVNTAGVSRQVKEQFYPKLRLLNSRIGNPVEVQEGRAFNRATGSRLVSFTADEPEHAEGWHPDDDPQRFGERNILAGQGVSDVEWKAMIEAPGGRKTSYLLIVDEAKGIGDAIIDGLERTYPTRWLMMSSPGDPVGGFYDAFNSKAELWPTRVHVKAMDCPHLWDGGAKQAELQRLIKVFGNDHPLIRSMIYGEFSQRVEGGIFDMTKVDAAMSGLLPKYGEGVRRAGLDLSGGIDEQVLVIADGNEAVIGGVWHERDEKVLVRNVIAVLKRWGVGAEWVNADDGGLGQIILNEFGRQHWDINRVRFDGKPRNERFYANVRTEMYCEAALRIKEGDIRLPRDTVLRDQLRWQRAKVNDENKLILVPKNTLPHSPDRSDSFVLAFKDFPLATEFADAREQRARAQDNCPGVDEALTALEQHGIESSLGWND